MGTCESGEREKDEAPSIGIPATGRALVARSARQLELDVVRSSASEQGAKPRRKIYDRERYIYNDLSRRSGAIVISSSRGSEFSYELEEIANGVFTEEILLALTSDVADRDHDGLVSTDELRTHLGNVVPKRTDDQQNPTVDRDNLDALFAFPVVTEATFIVDRTDALSDMSIATNPTSTNSKGASAHPPAARPHACGCDVAARDGWVPSVMTSRSVIAAAMGRRRR